MGKIDKAKYMNYSSMANKNEREKKFEKLVLYLKQQKKIDPSEIEFVRETLIAGTVGKYISSETIIAKQDEAKDEAIRKTKRKVDIGFEINKLRSIFFVETLGFSVDQDPGQGAQYANNFIITVFKEKFDRHFTLKKWIERETRDPKEVFHMLKHIFNALKDSQRLNFRHNGNLDKTMTIQESEKRIVYKNNFSHLMGTESVSIGKNTEYPVIFNTNSASITHDKFDVLDDIGYLLYFMLESFKNQRNQRCIDYMFHILSYWGITEDNQSTCDVDLHNIKYDTKNKMLLDVVFEKALDYNDF